MEAGANIIYLLLLLVLVGGAFFVRGNVGKNINYLITWALILLVLTLGYRAYQRFMFTPRAVEGGDFALRVPFDQNVGGYRLLFEANGVSLEGIVDTGATQIVLSMNDAKKAGIPVDSLSFSIPVNTANGTTYAAPAMLDQINLGEVFYQDINILVSQDGDLEKSLLGMTLLRRFDAFTIEDDYLLIRF